MEDVGARADRILWRIFGELWGALCWPYLGSLADHVGLYRAVSSLYRGHDAGAIK